MRSESLRCPNCQAPLPAPGEATQVRCEYCNHVARLRRTIAPDSQAPVQLEVINDAGRKAGAIIAAVIIAMVLGIGAVIAVVVIGSVKKATETSSQVQERAARLQREALDQAERLQREAFAQVDRALEKTGAARARAEDDAAERAERARRPSKKRSKRARRAKKPAPPLPAHPDLATVKRKLAGIDVSGCPGDFAITFGVRVMPDGATRITSVGPVRTKNGGTIACARRELVKLRFAKSREGLTLKHQLRGGTLK